MNKCVLAEIVASVVRNRTRLHGVNIGEFVARVPRDLGMNDLIDWLCSEFGAIEARTNA